MSCLYCGCPGSLEVGKLKLLCQRLFKVPTARQALFLKVGGENPMPDNIGQDDSKDLMFFSVEVRLLSFRLLSDVASRTYCWHGPRALRAQPNTVTVLHT